MVPIQDFLPYVLPYVQGCTDPLAEQHIRDVLIDFCIGSSIVQVTLDPIDVQAGQTEIDIDTPNGSVTALILQASYQGIALDVEKDSDTVFLGTAIPAGTPTAIKQTPTNSFTLNRVPQFDTPAAIQMLVATKPTRTAISVADILMEYAYEIGQGVVGRLMLMPNQDFTAPQLAGIYTATYTNAKLAARIRAERTFGSATSRVRSRPFS